MLPIVEHEFINGVEHKLCIGELCKENQKGVWKCVKEFNNNSETSDKLATICKECEKAYLLSMLELT